MGLVGWTLPDGSLGYLWALRHGETTWAVTPCVTASLLTDAERASACEAPLRPLGWGRAIGNKSCIWRLWRVAREGPRGAAVTILLDPHEARLERWAGAEPGQARVERGSSRTWIARGARWKAAVRVSRSRCGEASGAALAARLVELAPDPPPPTPR